jgi:hypothetical protein
LSEICTTFRTITVDCQELATYVGVMKQPVNLALSEDVRRGLDKVAAEQQCSRSWLADRALRDWLAVLASTSPATSTPQPTTPAKSLASAA